MRIATTSAAAGYDKGWKWDDPKWTQVAGSLAELLGPGPPDFFISHNWGGSFAHFVAAVERHFKTRVDGKIDMLQKHLVLSSSSPEDKKYEALTKWSSALANLSASFANRVQ